MRPPYRAKDLAAATSLSPGYVSRALDTLEAEALIQRKERGAVTDVDWASILLFRAAGYDLFRSNNASSYVAQKGWTSVPFTLPPELVARRLVASTGSVAAAEIRQITAPGQLVLYVKDELAREQVRAAGCLLPMAQGGDVVLIVPADPSQLWGAVPSIPLPRVADSQVVLDCLGGNGRLPEEGRAVLEKMRESQDRWRLRTLDDLAWPRP